jgi:hypothetical protein
LTGNELKSIPVPREEVYRRKKSGHADDLRGRFSIQDSIPANRMVGKNGGYLP